MTEKEFPLELLKVEGNEICADCNTPDPKWASTNLGVLICIKCSGVHRNLGAHISKLQSIVLDNKWSDELLENIVKKGNSKVNQELEFNLGSTKKPNSESSPEERTIYITKKYVDFAFATPELTKKYSSTQSKTSKLISSKSDVGLQEYSGILKITLYGASKLPAKDLNGTSDPFFIFSIGKQKIQSKTIYKSLSPYYEKQQLMLCITGKDVLKISCFDEDYLKSADFIGETTLDLSEIIKVPNTTIDYKLGLKDGKKSSGTVDFSLIYSLIGH